MKKEWERLEPMRIRIMSEAYDLADRGDSEGYNSVKVMCSDVLALIETEIATEREACAKVVESDGLARGQYGYMLTKAAARIRARGHDLQTAIEKGTKAWADVPNATEWIEELRGSDTPEVTPEVDNAYTKLDTKAGVLHKEWVGLSEDEFEKILETHNEAFPFAIYLSIEAKLKEKNNG